MGEFMPASFVYAGERVAMQPAIGLGFDPSNPRAETLMGYHINCPKCGEHMRLDIRSNHTLTIDAEGRPTVNPSLICPHNCGWHVWPRSGEATDA